MSRAVYTFLRPLMEQLITIKPAAQGEDGLELDSSVQDQIEINYGAMVYIGLITCAISFVIGFIISLIYYTYKRKQRSIKLAAGEYKHMAININQKSDADINIT
eukprot:19908_1